MAIRDHIDYLTRDPGILAFVVVGPAEPVRRGDDRLTNLAHTCSDPVVRFYVGDVVIVAHRFDEELVALAYPVGHVVAKSMTRALERARRRAPSPAHRGLVVIPEPRDASARARKSRHVAPSRAIEVPTDQPARTPPATGAWFGPSTERTRKPTTDWQTDGLPVEATRPW